MAHEAADRLVATEQVFETEGAPGEPLTTREVADALDLTRRSAYERLSTLAEQGAVETKKVGARGRIWWQPPDADGERAFTEAILDAQTDIIYAYDPDGRLQHWNERVEAVTGYTPAELGGFPVEEFVPAEYRDEVRDTIERIVSTGEVDTSELLLETADGERLPYETTGVPITDEEGTVTAVAGIGRDVSDRLARERQLRRERDFSDQLIEAAPASIAVFGAGGTVVRANQGARERLGLGDAEEASIAPGDLDVYTAEGDPVAPAERPTRRAFETGEAVTDLHCQIDLPDRGMQWLSIDAIPLGDGEDVERVLVATQDISELKHRTRQLERERATLVTELEDVFARVDDGFVALDHEFRYTFVNEQAEAMLERPAEDLLGREVEAVFPEAEVTRDVERYEAAMESQSPVSFETYYDRIERWLEVTAYPSKSGLSIYFRDVTERKEREQALQNQRERLAALHNLNSLVRDINEAVLRQSTREDIEELVCTQIADTESYEFAWVGEADATSGTFDARVEAGTDGYVDEVAIGTAAEPVGQGPAGRALRTGECQFSSNAHTDPRFAPWREFATEFGFQAAAAIPIVHEDTTYGVLCLYADRSGAFTDEEREVVGHLGEVIGHAIAAVERKRALMSDDVVEIELYVPNALGAVADRLDPDVRVTFDQTVPVGEGNYVVYGTTSPAGLTTVRDLVDHLDHWESVTELFGGEQGVRYELALSEPPVISAIASNGGSVASAAVEDGEYHVVVHLPTGVDVRGFVDDVGEAAPEMVLVARRQRSRDRSTAAVAADLTEALTDRQRATLEASFHAGYFDWPRECDGNDLAETLDISPPTFHQHLRSAQRKLLAALLE